MQHKDDDEGGLTPAGPARSVEEEDPVMCWKSHGFPGVPALSKIVPPLLFCGRSIGDSAASTRITSYSISLFSGALRPGNPLTHVDFLLFRRMDKSPLLAVEVDGTAFHRAGSVRAARDERKNRIFEKCGIPLLRLRTDGSGEKERIEQGLRSALSEGH